MAKNITKLRHRFQFLAQNWLALILISVSLTLAFLNYQPGTWLTGWDNLHPEFNFAVNIKRSIFALWQEYQSLGLLGGMAHAADLPRQLILLLFSTLLPASFLRYLWTFLMLTIGPLGIYVFLKNIFLKHHFDSKTIHFASFLGGLFYLLNLSTVQHFYTPFETFTSFYGFFPWLIFSFFYFFDKPSPKRFLLLSVISLLSAPSFYTETMFVVLCLCLASVFLDFFLSYSHRRRTLLEFIPALLGVIIPQLYWLLPVVFFVTTNGAVGLTAKINLVSTPETIYRNLEFGSLKNIALLRGFWFNFLDLSGGQKFDYLLLSWRNHLANPTTLMSGYLFFVLVLTGAAYSFSKKIRFRLSIIFISFVSLFFIMGGQLLLNRSLPLVTELFRSPFTKFSTVLAFSYSVFFSVGTIFLLDLFSFLHSRLTYYLTLFTIGLALIIYMTPAFTGNLIDPNMRLKIPSEYFALFDFFKNQDPNTRIANFPQYTFYGWDYYNWGYRGSGFLWYGIKQPILDRAFDVWEHSSEKYYEEITTALYGENQGTFENLIAKYAINWIVLDKNVIAPATDTDLGNEKLEKILHNSTKFTLAANINDTIFIYKTNVDQQVKNFLGLSPNTDLTLHSFSDVGLRPFPPEIKDDQIILRSAIPAGSKTLEIPSFTDSENLIPVAISYRKTPIGLALKLEPILPQISLNAKKISLTAKPNLIDFPLQETQSGLILGLNNQYTEVQLPDELSVQSTFYPLMTVYLPAKDQVNLTLYSNTPTYSLDLTSSFAAAAPYQCYTNKPNRKIEKIIDGQTVSLLGTDLVGCLSVPIPQAFGMNQLLSLEFTYWSNTNTPGNALITDTSLGGEISPQPLVAKNTPTFTRVFLKARTIPLQANLILEANEIKSTQEIDYKKVQVSYLPQLGEADFIMNPIPSQQTTLGNGLSVSSLSISLPITDSPFTLTSMPDSSLFSAAPLNCDPLNQTKFDRQTNKDGFLYTAVNADSCDQINLKHLPHSLSYALLIDSQNKLSLSPTVCLENHSTRRCDIFERLINGQQLILNPINNPNESPGYTFHIFNQSFGNRETQNLVRSVTIFPLPLNFLKSISLSTEQTQPQVVSTPLISSTHPAEFLYTASITKLNDAPLNLYQTKSPYWKAIEVSENDLKLPLWLLIAKIPSLYFSSNRLAMNRAEGSGSWYNSWDLPSGEHNLIIFYAPQYLEFLGFLLLLLPFIALLFYSPLKKLATPHHNNQQA